MMFGKIHLVWVVILLTVLAMPALAAVTVTYPAITHSWPDNSADVRDSSASGSRLWVNTMAGTIFNGDPNDLYSEPCSPPHLLVGESFNDRAVTETFGIPIDGSTPYGFTLTHIVIAANGNGSDANQPMSLHIYDLNTASPWPYTGTQANYNLVGGTGSATTANDAMLSPGDYFPSTSTFVFRRDATPNLPHTFVDFNFTGYDSFDLEPNHEYAFEIWPTKGNNPGWNWHRDTANQNYPYGLCYSVDPPNDYRDLTVPRQAVDGGMRVAVMGVYGIPCDGNAFHPEPRNLEIDVPLDTQLRWHSGKWCGPGPDSNHMLYFSTSEVAVRSRGSASRIGRLTDANFTDPNEPNWKPQTALLPDKVYYWRVDEYNNVKQAGYWGRSNYGYWRFATKSVFAKNPVPTNYNTAIFTLTNDQLSWTKGCYAADVSGHQVYFGTSFDDVNNATTATPIIYRGAVTDPCYLIKNLAPDYTPLTSGAAYYWRIDEVNSAQSPYVWKGPTWCFTYSNPIPVWAVSGKVFENGPPGSFDEVSVKDPSIVYSGGKWHLFYTGRDSSTWRIGYASATSIAGLKTANHILLSSLSSGNFAAPQILWFEPQSTWYLIYWNSIGQGVKGYFSTNTDINDPNGWTVAADMGFSETYALDFWVISDGDRVYCFYSPQNNTTKRCSTTIADFPYNWSETDSICPGAWEGACVYKNIADGNYYMMIEDVGRYFELWTATSLGGTWTKIEEKWASVSNIAETKEHWTTQVSHGEIIRAGVNERMEISDINNCEILFQGMLPGEGGGGYDGIAYRLGMMWKCPGSPGDIDHDCDVDFADFAYLSSQWLQWPGVPSADIAPPGGDSIVDMDDLGLLTDGWLAGKEQILSY